MALRGIVTKNEDVLRKRSKVVTAFDEKLCKLIDDMKETMYTAKGYGLAAPQVGYLKRVVVIDVGDGLIEAINPEISDFEGTQRDVEGCLSCPGEYGFVERPLKCILKAQDREGNWYEKEMTGLACRCACHETDHLEGVLFLDKVDEMVEIQG